MTGLIPFASDAAAVGVGAVCGALCRHQLGRLAAEQVASHPQRFGKYSGWHTAGINVVGSFCLGGIAGTPVIQNKPMVSPRAGMSKATLPMFHGLTPRAKLMLGVGFCGSFTTFSTYSVDIVNWISKGETTKAVAYAVTNNIGGVLAAAAGMVLVKKFF